MSEEAALPASGGEAGNGQRPAAPPEVPPSLAGDPSGAVPEGVSELDALDASAEEVAAARGEAAPEGEVFGDGEAAGEGDADAALAQLRQETISELERERDEYLDMLRRLQAEFENYRKRIERNQREIVENANAALVRKLLPVLDTADLALAHGGSEDVKQVASALFDVLKKEGLERIDPEGERFDPEHHDAVAHEPVEGGEAPDRPQVSEVMRAGYRWKGRVLRPAMVKVRG
jgi:molecular chaperone GrpE